MQINKWGCRQILLVPAFVSHQVLGWHLLQCWHYVKMLSQNNLQSYLVRLHRIGAPNPRGNKVTEIYGKLGVDMGVSPDWLPFLLVSLAFPVFHAHPEEKQPSFRETISLLLSLSNTHPHKYTNTRCTNSKNKKSCKDTCMPSSWNHAQCSPHEVDFVVVSC